jgi:hypothetical protein
MMPCKVCKANDAVVNGMCADDLNPPTFRRSRAGARPPTSAGVGQPDIRNVCQPDGTDNSVN